MSSYLIDRATGKRLRDTPEERVRQDVEKFLHEEYGYPYSCMGIEYPVRMGSKTKKADIVLFRSDDPEARDPHKDVVGLVEIKPKEEGLSEAEEQLKSYMAATSSCEWGMAATNKPRRYFARHLNDGAIVAIHNIPRHGYSVASVAKITKDELKPAKNLKIRFRNILYTIYSDAGGNRSVLCNEIVKILFCKIYDEKLPDDEPYFQTSSEMDASSLKRSIEKNLWKGVLKGLVKAGIFSEDEELHLDAESLQIIVADLERVKLSETDYDVVGAAFEVFAEDHFKGERGEFFTPRVAVRLMVEIMNPEYGELVLDPACGSGGFLIYALEHIWNKIENERRYKNSKSKSTREAPSYIHGIDREGDLVKIARAYMTIIGDGHTNIVKQDSLIDPQKWGAHATFSLLTEKGQPKRADVILTNPPFGKKITVKDKKTLRNYDLGHKWQKGEAGYVKTNSTQETAPHSLFLEMCVRWLKPGGRMAIVLPEGIFGNPSEGYVRQWISENLIVIGVIDCPQGLFLPHTNTKTCIMFAQKPPVRQEGDSIFMSVLKKCGHDQRGNEIFREDGIVEEDFSSAVRDWENVNPHDEKWKGENSFLVKRDSIEGGILVPRFYQYEEPKGGVEIGKLIDAGALAVGTVPVKIKATDYIRGDRDVDASSVVPFLRTSDIGVMEMRVPINHVDLEAYENNKKLQDLQSNDILFVKDGTYRIGESVILSKYQVRMVVQGHFYKFRVLDTDQIDPFFLYWRLQTGMQRHIYRYVFIQATLSSITLDRLKRIKLDMPDIKTQRKIGEQVKKLIRARDDARSKFEQLEESL